MAGETDQIALHIHQQRRELDANIHALTDRAKCAVDWRAQFELRPMTMLGIAFGGGAVLSLFAGGSRRGASAAPDALALPASAFATTSRRWENVRSALLGVAAARLAGAMERVLPGFEKELKKSVEGGAPAGH